MAEATTHTTVSYFPGCSGHGTGVEYDTTTRAVCKALGIELREIDDWNCCGATSAHALDNDLSMALGARNLALAEASGQEQLMVPCAACFNRLRHAAVHVEEQGTPLGLPSVQGSAEVVHLLDLFDREERIEALQARKFNDLGKLKVVPYYGCLITRPPEVTGAVDPENPTSMDRLLERMDVEVATWPYKTRCCGTSLSMTRSDLVEQLSSELVRMAQRAGAEAIVTACPLCFVNLDTRQQVAKPLPVLYITEVMALYMDLDGTRSLLKRHQVTPIPLLRSKGMF